MGERHHHDAAAIVNKDGEAVAPCVWVIGQVIGKRKNGIVTGEEFGRRRAGGEVVGVNVVAGQNTCCRDLVAHIVQPDRVIGRTCDEDIGRNA